MKLKAALFAVLSLASLPSLGIEVLRVDNNPHALILSGEIEQGDLEKVISAVSPPNHFPKYFTLDSPGGDVAEAMKIGRFVRDTATGTFVANTCASACIFILVAGTSQSALPSSAIGLHRPYFSPEAYNELSLPETEKGYQNLIHAARSYLMGMEFPLALIEKMFSISSDDTYFLTADEKQLFLRRSSAYDEWVKARCRPPSAQEWELFRRRGFNVFDQFDDPPPSNPHFIEFMSRYNQANACEERLVQGVREDVLRKNVGSE